MLTFLPTPLWVKFYFESRCPYLLPVIMAQARAVYRSYSCFSVIIIKHRHDWPFILINRSSHDDARRSTAVITILYEPCRPRTQFWGTRFLSDRNPDKKPPGRGGQQ